MDLLRPLNLLVCAHQRTFSFLTWIADTSYYFIVQFSLCWKLYYNHTITTLLLPITAVILHLSHPLCSSYILEHFVASLPTFLFYQIFLILLFIITSVFISSSHFYLHNEPAPLLESSFILRKSSFRDICGSRQCVVDAAQISQTVTFDGVKPHLPLDYSILPFHFLQLVIRQEYM